MMADKPLIYGSVVDLPPAIESAPKRIFQESDRPVAALLGLKATTDIPTEPTPINRVWFWQVGSWMAAQPGGGISDSGLHWWNPFDWGLALRPRVRAAWKDGDSWMVAL